MKPAELYTRFRNEMVDQVEPFLWTKDDVWSYLVDAQEMFCRLTGGLRDASSLATIGSVVIGDPFVDLHPAVMWIRSASLASTGGSVHLFSYEDIAGANGTPTAFPLVLTGLSLAGPIRGAIIGMEEGRLRLTSVPEEEDELNLLVERLPLEPPSEKVDFEIRKEHHLNLLLWMKHRAYAKPDSETLNESRSAEMKADFEAYCTAANAEKQRRNYKPRLIAYGGY